MPASQALPKSSSLRAAWRTLLTVLWVAFLFPFVLLLYFLRLNHTRAKLVRVFYYGMCGILGIRTHLQGSLSKERPLLVVSNHASYLDVFVLGTLFPVSFTPKREVRSWPVIGFLCVLADCVFVERKPSHMVDARDKMQDRLDTGKVVCIFPEGTTNNGREVAGFKSGFFSLTEEVEMPVQPMTLAYTKLSGAALTSDNSDHVAWVGEATFFDHFWRVMGYRSIDVTVLVHPLQYARDFADRKVLSLQCETLVRGGLESALNAQGA